MDISASFVTVKHISCPPREGKGEERGSREAVKEEESGGKVREVIQCLPVLLFGVNDNFLVQLSWQQCFCYQGFSCASLLISQHDH